MNSQRSFGGDSRRRLDRVKRIRPGVRQLLDAMTDIPAFVQSGRLDIVAANTLGWALLRAEAGRNPDDRTLTGLIGLIAELTLRGERFSTLWATHNVRWHTTGTKHFHHRVAGDLSLAYEALELTAPLADAGHLHRGPGQPVEGGSGVPRQLGHVLGAESRRAG